MFANLKQKGTEFSNKAHRFFLPTEVTTIAKNLFSGGMLLYALPMMTMAAGIDDMFGTLISYVFKIFFYIGATALGKGNITIKDVTL